MIRKLLVANRGEIALRVFRAARELGIETVAVVAPDDKGSLHARSADETVEIGSYLFSEEHIRAAKQTGADAIHPGYGFLAENPDFAEAVNAAELVWVGPPPDALRVGGDKLEAKRIAQAAGVPVVPSGEPDEIGFPLVVKAAAGGGGRGMRVVRDPAELAEALEASRREAKAAFGDDRVFCERYVERPRHIEIQLLADTHGTVLSLGERECSIQRRHQKVLEESPSPVVDERLRTALGDAAVAFAQAIGYVSAGTAEFMVDGSDFWFLELNGRIQVEHPVTELVTGVDLVQAQLRVAAGDELDRQARPARPRRRGAPVRGGPEDFLPANGPPRAPALSRRDQSGRRRRGRRRDRDRIRPDDREADRPRDDARRGVQPLGCRAAGDRGRRRDDQPSVPPLARVAPGRARRRHENVVPDRASPALPGARPRGVPLPGALPSASISLRRCSPRRRTSTPWAWTTGAPGESRAS